MKEKVKGGKDEEVNGQGQKRGAPAPHGANNSFKLQLNRFTYYLYGSKKHKKWKCIKHAIIMT